MIFCSACLEKPREKFRRFWSSLRNACLGNREYTGKVVQNMKDRLRHDESIWEISLNFEKMHISIWTRFMASSMHAALHMDHSYEKNLELCKISKLENIKVLFGITRMMIEGNWDIKNVFPADVAASLWEKKPVLHKEFNKVDESKIIRLLRLRVVHRKMHGPEDAIKRWNLQVSTLKMCHTFRELQRLDGGEPIDFQWKSSQESQRTFSTKCRQTCKESTSHLKTSVIE